MSTRGFAGPYRDEQLTHIAFPLGGIGAGSVCLEGNGALGQASLRHRPDLLNDPRTFAAVHVHHADQTHARVVEGPVPASMPLARENSSNQRLPSEKPWRAGRTTPGSARGPRSTSWRSPSGPTRERSASSPSAR